jgi:hypothetical protein
VNVLLVSGRALVSPDETHNRFGSLGHIVDMADGVLDIRRHRQSRGGEDFVAAVGVGEAALAGEGAVDTLAHFLNQIQKPKLCVTEAEGMAVLLDRIPFHERRHRQVNKKEPRPLLARALQ